jgi:hypothetical protein
LKIADFADTHSKVDITRVAIQKLQAQGRRLFFLENWSDDEGFFARGGTQSGAYF